FCCRGGSAGETTGQTKGIRKAASEAADKREDDHRKGKAGEDHGATPFKEHHRACAPPMPPPPVCGDQSGLTSAPIRLQLVQTMRGSRSSSAVSSGSQSALSFALWWHQPDVQYTSKSRQPWLRTWPSVRGQTSV